MAITAVAALDEVLAGDAGNPFALLMKGDLLARAATTARRCRSTGWACVARRNSSSCRGICRSA